MADPNEAVKSMNESVSAIQQSVSTVFRHIFPGLLIIMMSLLAFPSWFSEINITNISINTLIVLGTIAMIIGNVWYAFHRYFVLLVLDLIAYYYRWPGKPARDDKSNFRGDMGVHVAKFFAAAKHTPAMAKHIRDRISSFNFMFIFAEALGIFSAFARPESALGGIRWIGVIFAFITFAAAVWQYSLVRCIDGEFVSLTKCTTQL